MPASRAHPRLRYRDDGLTLMEMVVAIGILMVVLVASLSVFITVQYAQRTAEGTDRAIQLANGRIERIRQLDWNQVGFYDNTFNASANAGSKTDNGTTAADYNAVAMPSGESTVRVGTTDPNTIPANIIDPYQVTTETGTKFSVYTTITWGTHPTYGAPTESGSTGTPTDNERYSFKRVRVTVTWQSGGNGASHKTVNETWFAPQSDDEAPPGIIVRDE
jgi:Tfp pilus assembly protein PilW